MGEKRREERLWVRGPAGRILAGTEARKNRGGAGKGPSVKRITKMGRVGGRDITSVELASEGDGGCSCTRTRGSAEKRDKFDRRRRHCRDTLSLLGVVVVVTVADGERSVPIPPT